MNSPKEYNFDRAFHTHVIPRLALLLFILLLSREDDRFSIGYLLARGKNI
ncbi:MAG TPA: hypothetical protein VF074_09585 [Pyrinomonadaceae bacterium]